MNQETLESSAEGVTKAIDLVLKKLDSWWETAAIMLPNILVAVLVLSVFLLLARLTRKLTGRLLKRVTSDMAISRMLARLAGILIAAVGLFIALGALKLDKTVTSLLAGAGVIGIALAFAFQDMAANLVAGIYMSFKRPFVPGDLIETNGVFGTVEKTDLRSTVLKTPDGQVVVIPNKEIFESKLTNFTATGSRRVDVPVGVSYGDDLEKAKQIALQAVSDLDVRDPTREPELFFDAFGSSSIDLTVRFWIGFSRQADYRAARSAAIMAIKKAFDAHDIAIPFPIRTLDFGIQGAEPVRQALSSAAGPGPA